jgi:hypothetical protein
VRKWWKTRGCLTLRLITWPPTLVIQPRLSLDEVGATLLIKLQIRQVRAKCTPTVRPPVRGIYMRSEYLSPEGLEMCWIPDAVTKLWTTSWTLGQAFT